MAISSVLSSFIFNLLSAIHSATSSIQSFKQQARTGKSEGTRELWSWESAAKKWYEIPDWQITVLKGCINSVYKLSHAFYLSVCLYLSVFLSSLPPPPPPPPPPLFLILFPPVEGVNKMGPGNLRPKARARRPRPTPSKAISKPSAADDLQTTSTLSVQDVCFLFSFFWGVKGVGVVLYVRNELIWYIMVTALTAWCLTLSHLLQVWGAWGSNPGRHRSHISPSSPAFPSYISGVHDFWVRFLHICDCFINLPLRWSHSVFVDGAFWVRFCCQHSPVKQESKQPTNHHWQYSLIYLVNNVCLCQILSLL